MEEVKCRVAAHSLYFEGRLAFSSHLRSYFEHITKPYSGGNTKQQVLRHSVAHEKSSVVGLPTK